MKKLYFLTISLLVISPNLLSSDTCTYNDKTKTCIYTEFTGKTHTLTDSQYNIGLLDAIDIAQKNNTDMGNNKTLLHNLLTMYCTAHSDPATPPHLGYAQPYYANFEAQKLVNQQHRNAFTRFKSLQDVYKK